MSVDDFTDPGNPEHAPVELASPAHGVTAWWVQLGASEEEVARLARWLAPEEHARAARYGRPGLAQRYIVGRASLRWILGRTIGLAPDAVPIQRDARGRPHLDGDFGIDFNVSNTEGVALIGITREGRIGVDIEHSARRVRVDGLARKLLTPAERATLAALDEDERRARFLRYWTCKEAMSKATGDGLAAPFREMEVEFGSGIALVKGPPPYESKGWSLYPVEVTSGFIATTALWSGVS